MESKINTVGLTIWGYKQGCKVLASQGVNFQLKEIKDRLKDLSAFIRIHIPRVDFYTLQFTQNYKIYTQYRSSREVNGQTGVYIAISLYIPHSLQWRGVRQVLNLLMDMYFAEHINYENGAPLLNEKEDIFPYFNLLRGYEKQLTEELDAKPCTLEMPYAPKVFSYRDIYEVDKYFNTPYRPEFSNLQDILFLRNEFVENPFAYSIELLFPEYRTLSNTAASTASNSGTSHFTISDKRIKVLAFGSRRAHGFDSAVEGNKAAIIGGCYGHSNLVTEYKYGIPSNGTMSHSYIQSFGVGAEAEKEAFVTFIKHRRQRKSNSLILLVDTYDTIHIGIENAIKAFKECGIDDSYEGIYGVRLDSGDLAYQSKKCRKRFDEEGFTKAKITLTNSLDEKLIRSLREQGACVDMYGVGDAIAVSKSYPCFGGVYKIVELDEEPLIKISGDVIKISNPGFKEVYRIFDKDGFAYADLISLVKDDNDKEKLLNNEELMIRDEKYEFKNSILKKDEYTYKKLTKLYIKDGVIDKKLHDELFDIMKSQKHYFDSLAKVSPERKRLENPHSYKVDLSSDLINLKYGLINKIKNV